MAGSMKQNCTSSCSWDCLWRLQDCLLRSLRNGRAIHFWMVEILKDKVLPSWVSGLRSICSTVNVENLLTFWDPVLLFIKIPNWHWNWIFIYWRFSLELGHGVLRGMCWKELHMGQIGTDGHKIPKWLLLKTVYHISWATGDSITCSLVSRAKWNLIIILLFS